MDDGSFDHLTVLLSWFISRRATFVGLAALTLPSLVDARRRKRSKRKHKKKNKQRVVFNAFGCVNVGSFCHNDEQCCSGICEGQKDKRTCQAHDDGGCPAGHQDSGCGGTTTLACTTSSGLEGVCETTTGNAGYCGNDYLCVDCRKDADCQELCGRLEAACVRCLDCDGTSTFQTACVGPFVNDCFVPGPSGLISSN